MNLTNLIKKKTKITFFTTPSHSQSLSIFSKLKQLYGCDISETDAYNPQKALCDSEKKASRIYGTKSTSYLLNGSTSGIIAAVLTCVKKDEKVLIWDKAHICHKNAVQLASAIPVYYELDKIENWGIYNAFSPEKIEEKLINNDIKALIITSPSYYGIVSDIAKIKNICTKYGTYLIVDEAHGALYPFSENLAKSAIYQNADFVVQSLHKTAGGLNSTALLHNNTNLDEKKALELITTTSPSYPLFASIEKNINYLNSQKGKYKIETLLNDIKNLKSEHYKNIEICEFNDPTKILIKHKTLSGYELSEKLYEQKIEDEKTNEVSTMLLTGIGCDTKKLERLKKVLKKL